MNEKPQKIMYFDIETLPLEAGRLKDLEKAYEKKKKKKDGKKILSFEEYVEQTGLDGTWGRIFCICYAIGDGPVKCLSGDEKKMLAEFWQVIRDVDLFVGFNVIDFDFRFLIQRSIILNIRPSRPISFRRYTNFPVFDVMWEWTMWGDRISMDELARALGLPSSKQAIDGSQVYEYYKKGKFEEITKYCGEDVLLTRKIYKRMKFES